MHGKGYTVINNYVRFTDFDFNDLLQEANNLQSLEESIFFSNVCFFYKQLKMRHFFLESFLFYNSFSFLSQLKTCF